MSETSKKVKEVSEKAIEELSGSAPGPFVIALALIAVAEQLERLANAQRRIAATQEKMAEPEEKGLDLPG